MQACNASTKPVIDDDTFEATVAAIVERDFYPHIKALQNKLEWTRAAASGDAGEVAAAQRNISLRRAGYSVRFGFVLQFHTIRSRWQHAALRHRATPQQARSVHSAAHPHASSWQHLMPCC